MNPSDEDRRRLVPWATIDGLRVIAARQGDYRPMEEPPTIEIDLSRADPDRNPLGIVRSEVRAWKRSEQQCFSVAGEAWWDEYAPLREEYADDGCGQRMPTGKMLLEASWARMGRVMIAKCAEAQALRRGWPDLLSGLYGEEELQSLKQLDESASERVARHSAQLDRIRCSAKETLWFVLSADAGLVALRRAEVASKLAEYLTQAVEVAKGSRA